MWWNKLKIWLQYKRVPKEAAAAGVALLLKDGAFIWYSSLSDSEKNDFDQLEKAFKKRYIDDAIESWHEKIAFYKITQGPNQDFDDYYTQMIVASQRVKATEDQIITAILNGTKSHIKNFILQHSPQSLEDLHRLGNLAQKTVAPQVDKEAIQDLMAQTRLGLDQIKQELRDLHRQPTTLSHFQANVGAQNEKQNSPMSYLDNVPGGSGFQNKLRPEAPTFYPSAPVWGQSQNNGGNWQYGGHQQSVRKNQYPKQLRSSDMSYQNQLPHNANWGQSRSFNAGKFNNRSNWNSTQRQCNKCGRLHPRNQCRAANLVCRVCGRRGHLAACCYQAQRPQA